MQTATDVLSVRTKDSVVCTDKRFCCLYRQQILLSVKTTDSVVWTNNRVCCLYKQQILLSVQTTDSVVCTDNRFCCLYGQHLHCLPKHPFWPEQGRRGSYGPQTKANGVKSRPAFNGDVPRPQSPVIRQQRKELCLQKVPGKFI